MVLLLNTCFQHDSAYSDSKDLVKRTQSDKGIKPSILQKNPKYDGYQRGLASMAYKFFDKKSRGSRINKENKDNFLQNSELANELH